MCIVISSSFMLNFSLSCLLRSNLTFDSLKTLSGLYSISPNSPRVQTIWIPHVEKMFISENWSAPKQTEQQKQGLPGRKEGGPRNWRWGSRRLFPWQQPAIPECACTCYAHYCLRSVYPTCICAYEWHRQARFDTAKDYPESVTTFALRGEEIMWPKVTLLWACIRS